MAFSMKLSAGKGKKKPLAAPATSGSTQYGLVLPKKDAKKKELSTGFNVFASAAAAEKSSKETAKERGQDAKRRVGAEAARSLQQSQVDKVRAQALADDPSVFDYDAVYDDMKSARQSEASKRATKREAEKKQPKYIGTLLQQAKIRDVENERIRERRLLNERKADDAMFGDKEKLVSASYKRKLQEMERWDAEDARLAAMEEQEDVTKQGAQGMAGFYANLNKNIAMGGSTENARSAYTAKEGRREQNVEEQTRREERESETIQVEAETKKPQSREQDEGRSSPVRHVVPERKEETDDEPKASKEDAIAAARARFLARKAQRTTPAN